MKEKECQKAKLQGSIEEMEKLFEEQISFMEKDHQKVLEEF